MNPHLCQNPQTWASPEYHIVNFLDMVPRLHENHAEVFVSDYSYRSATMGSTFAARRAGT
jgi:hypothetical protein